MKFITVLIFVFYIFNSNCEEKLSRSKRFLSSLWPSSSNSEKNEMVYLHLPSEYVELMHQELQSRSDNNVSPPMRLIHPTKMMALVRNQPVPVKQSPPPTPKIIMKPVPELTPSIKVNTQEQALPEIHKTHRFVTPTPFPQKAVAFSHQQALPIKRNSNIVSMPMLTIKTADISEFYYTQEFNELLKEFKLKVDRSKLPDIKEVMILLGTENAEETMKAIREVANTPEGMSLITSYLDGMDRVEDDEFYRYDEDVGKGEIHVSGVQSDYHQNYIHDSGVLQSDDASQYNFSPVEQPVTVTPLASNSWWNWWWGTTTQSTRTDSRNKDVEIVSNAVRPANFSDGVNYVRNFLRPASTDSIPIDPPLKIMNNNEGRLISSEIHEETQTMPTVQMTQEQFEKMVKDLKLSPINPQTTTTTTVPPPPATLPTTTIQTTEEAKVFESPINVVVPEETLEIDIPDPQVPKKVNIPPQLSEFENRRSFEKKPVRHSSPIESRTGKLYQVDPDVVEKESQSLSSGFDGNYFQSII